MLETTREICKKCGKEYSDTHIVPRAIYAPYYCDAHLEELNSVCGGWLACAYQASRKLTTPFDED